MSDEKKSLGADERPRRAQEPAPVASDAAAHAALAKAIIDAIPGALGITPDPWPEEPDERDGEPHRTVERLIREHTAMSQAVK